jgi:hypothetical protein
MIALSQYINEGIMDIENNLNSNIDTFIVSLVQEYPTGAKRSAAFKKLYEQLKSDVAKKSEKMPWLKIPQGGIELKGLDYKFGSGWARSTLGDITFFKDHTFYIMFNKNSATGVSNREHPELCIFYTDFSDSRINDYKTYYKAIKKTKLKDDWQLGILNTAHSSWGVTMKMKDYPDCEIYELPDEYKEVWKLVVERITDPRYSDYSRWMKCLE